MDGIGRHGICVLLVLAQLQGICRAETAYLEPARVYAGDIAELVIEYDNTIPSLYALDTSALLTDFEVLDIKSRVARREEADRVFHRMQWRIQILPRKTGKLQVPEIRFGDNKTPLLTLEVLAATAELQSSQAVFVETEASPADPYVGQQTQISVRLYHNIPLDYGSLSEPEADNTIIYRHRNESSYRIHRDGQEFQVLERGFTLVAQQAGAVVLSPASYRGILPQAAGATAGTALNHKRKISRSSNALTLQVRPPPVGYSGRFWLPAAQLQISEGWGSKLQELRVGESLEWTLTITAHGLPAQSLPADLLVMDSDRVRIYADQEIRQNRFEGKLLIGRLEQRFAVVATGAGEIMLPEVRLSWWDIESDSERVAVLARRTIRAVDSVAGAGGQLATSQSLFQRLRVAVTTDQNRLWMGVMTAVILLGFLFIGYHVLRRRIRSLIMPLLRRQRIRKQLRRACLANDAAAARSHIIEWGRERWPNVTFNGLYQLEKQIRQGDLAVELARLDAALFASAGNGDGWQGAHLLRLISALERQPRATGATRNTILPRLYPE